MNKRIISRFCSIEFLIPTTMRKLHVLEESKHDSSSQITSQAPKYHFKQGTRFQRIHWHGWRSSQYTSRFCVPNKNFSNSSWLFGEQVGTKIEQCHLLRYGIYFRHSLTQVESTISFAKSEYSVICGINVNNFKNWVNKTDWVESDYIRLRFVIR